MNAILWLELRGVPVYSTLALGWTWTIPAIAATANGAMRLGFRRLGWTLAALAWEVWDAVPAGPSRKAWIDTTRRLPWSGGCEIAWKMAAR